jgi:chorismate dehydratase
MSDSPRLAASNYSNSAPLVWSFWHGAKQNEVEYLPDAAPSKCAEMLRQAAVEIALTPVIEYQRIANTVIIPEVCVASNEQVRSVILVTKGDELKNAKSVALDTSSRTSVALTQVIFQEFFSRKPEFVSHQPDIETMLAAHDAALLIGDPALRVDKAKFRVFDIVEIWREFTGLGFVFAFWLARKEALEAARKIDFTAARDEGLAKIDEIINFYSPVVPLERADFHRYLTQNITYHLNQELLDGLQLYFRLACKHNLINALRNLELL